MVFKNLLNRLFLLALQLAQVHLHLAYLPLVVQNCLLQVLAFITKISLVIFGVFLIFLLVIGLVSISFRSQDNGRGRLAGPYRESDRFTLKVFLIDRVHRILSISRVKMIMMGFLFRLFHIGMQ